MLKDIDILVKPDHIENDIVIQSKLRNKLALKAKQPFAYKLIKKSIDARRGSPKYVLKYRIGIGEKAEADYEKLSISFHNADTAKTIYIIGAGPAGYFAALECLELGMRPIILERGKDVRARRRDLRAIQQMGEVNPDSNYCFGEGGAGTYSDGKLYTRSKKRGKIIKTLKLLVDHGAKSDILVDAHPHIGSNKLPGIISNIRASIEKFGGEVRFENKVTDFIIENNQLKGLIVNQNEEIITDKVILATGHSARDIFQLLKKHKVYMEAKPFAIGIRIEHPQPLIDEIQYGQSPRSAALPASSYKLVTQVNNSGVFSFCMCPGGLIVPAATAPGEIVVNGMSLSKRDSPFANSGIVTQISNEDTAREGYQGVFANLDFQRDVERHLFSCGDGSQKAPAQNLIDFVNGQDMLELNDSSYIPGLYRAPLHELLPPFVYDRLKNGLLAFSLKMNGYFTDAANVVAVESRTSSPVKIPRYPDTSEHIEIKGLFPCGEGAGYAGGILSAAMDGQRVAKAIYAKFFSSKE